MKVIFNESKLKALGFAPNAFSNYYFKVKDIGYAMFVNKDGSVEFSSNDAKVLFQTEISALKED